MTSSTGQNRKQIHRFFARTENRPLVIAHRGGAGEWPGETLYAFRNAVDLGVDMIEMDVHATKDGELVLIHNRTLERTTDGRGRVNRYTLSEIRELDAGCRWTGDGGKTFPFKRDLGRKIDIRVPTLDEVFKEFKDFTTLMCIEIKQVTPSIAAPLADLIRDFDMTKKVLVASFYGRALREFRKEAPDVATSASTVELFKYMPIASLVSGRARRGTFDAVQVGIRLPLINRKSVGASHRLDLPIHAWTVNRRRDMEHMISLQVDGIITDYPSLLMSII